MEFVCLFFLYAVAELVQALCHKLQGLNFDFLDEIFNFLIHLILLEALWLYVPLAEMSTRRFSVVKVRPAFKADNLNAICYQIV
jgi:hypothetical protein